MISIPYCLSIKKTIRINASIHHSLDKSLSRQASPRSSRSGSCSCRTSRTGSPGRQRRTSIRSCRSVGYNRFYDTALYSFAVSMSYNRFCNTEQLCSVNEFYNENEFYNTVHLCNAVSMSYNTAVHVHRSVSRDSGGGLAGCPVYRVVMLGGGGVGKSAICSQFLSSDHVNTYESVGNTSSEICRDFTVFYC